MQKRGATVWIDDTHPIFRRGMAACFAAEGFRVVGESADLEPGPQLAHLDLLVFEADGRNLRRAVRFVRDLKTRLVATVRTPVDALLCDLVEAGVAAVLIQPSLSPGSLLSAARTALNGNTSLPRDVVPRLLEQAARGAHHAPGSLTTRELDVLRLLAEGEDTRDIAGALCYSERTVKNVVHDVLTKMNCRNRAHAVALATRQGVI